MSKKSEKDVAAAEVIEVEGKHVDLSKVIPPNEEGVNVLSGLHSKRSARWTSTKPRIMLLCIAAALYNEEGYRGRQLFLGFKGMVPDYPRHFDVEPTAKAIIAKGYNVWFYDSENPKKNWPAYYQIAVALVKRAGPVDIDEVIASLEREIKAA